MSHKRRVYLLDPQEIPPETIAVAFAKTSRSPASFDEIASELTRETSSEFHEKWVVGYGHSSVAEHAVVHLALENISRLAIESVESNRLASYTEKSTRYQKWDSSQYYIPEEFTVGTAGKLFQSTCQLLLDTYKKTLEPVKSVIANDIPRKNGESDTSWDRRIRSEYVDVCRFLLPAASLANVGITINARALEHAIRKMLSHPLLEVQEIGREVILAAQGSVPTLIKYVDKVPYMIQVRDDFAAESQKLQENYPNEGNWCHLVDFDPNGLLKNLAAILYRYGETSYDTAFSYARNCTQNELDRLFQMLLENLGEHDQPVREMEYANFLFDIIMDQGAYFELKRHRMLTLTSQKLTTGLGYAIPRKIVEAGQEKPYRTAMEEAHKAFEILSQYNPEAASYLVPNGYNRRALLNINLRSAMHLISLRSASNAHFSIRRVVQKMAADMIQAVPMLENVLCRNLSESWQGIQEKYFSQIS
jgi:thymidylate synthase ThyX